MRTLCVRRLIKSILMIVLCLYTVKPIIDRDKIKKVRRCSGPCRKEIKGILDILTVFHIYKGDSSR